MGPRRHGKLLNVTKLDIKEPDIYKVSETLLTERSQHGLFQTNFKSHNLHLSTHFLSFRKDLYIVTTAVRFKIFFFLLNNKAKKQQINVEKDPRRTISRSI